MSKFTLVSYLLQKLLPFEVSHFAIQIYTVVPSQKFKPGQVVFHFPCGHISRNIYSDKYKEFFYSYDGRFYSFKNDIYNKVDEEYDDDSYKIQYVASFGINDKPTISCNVCDQS